MRVIAVHVHFRVHRKTHAVVDLAEALDVVRRAWFLFAELVTREPEYDQPAVFEFLIQFFEAFVLRSETTFTGGVHDQQDLVLVFRHRFFRAAQRFDFDIVNITHCLC